MERRTKIQEKVSDWQWKKLSTLIIGDCDTTPSTKIASFDMDDTLIKVKSGAKFPKDASDWLLWDEDVPKKISQLSANGYKIVIFTNQNGITTGKTNPQHIKRKIQDLSLNLGVKIQAFIASADDQYRKPSTKMWNQLQSNYNGGIKINKSQSFFCGDAAGRKTKTHKDFSDSDLKFALNVGVSFKTPQVLFLNEKEQVLEIKGFNPKTIPTTGFIFQDEKINQIKPVEKQMIIFCGPPGGGKSTFWSNYLSSYSRINRDTLKTKQKCYKVAEQQIKKGKSVVIDNTCPSKADRAYFLQLAKKYNYQARCFYFTTSKDICFHNDYMRVVNNKRQHFSGKAGSIPIHSWFKNMEVPTVNQGFKEVKKVSFIAKFNNDEDKDAYHSFSKK